MILKRVGSLLAIGLFVVAVGYNVRLLLTPRTPVPAIDCPDVVDLGDGDLGEIAVKRLTITNTGDSELLISKVRSSCSCSGLELDGGSHALSFTEVSIAPGEAKKFVVRLSVRGNPGESVRQSVHFETNDPARPAVEFDVVVPRVRGISCSPTSVVAGAVPVGKTVRHRVSLREYATAGLKLERVECDPKSSVQVQSLTHTDTTAETGWHDVSQFEVCVTANESGPINTMVTLHLKRDNTSLTFALPVSANAVRPVEVSPKTLRLPRSSDDGPVYTAECFCRCTEGSFSSLEVASADSGLRAEVLAGSADSPVRLVRVTYDPTYTTQHAGARKVRLKATTTDGVFPIEIDVDCPQPE